MFSNDVNYNETNINPATCNNVLLPGIDSLMHEKEKNLLLEERVELTLKDIQSM